MSIQTKPRYLLPVAALLFPAIVVVGSNFSSAAESRLPAGRSAPIDPIPAALQPVQDCAGLRSYVTDALVDSLVGNRYGSWWDTPWSEPGGVGGGPSDFSGTNNQEDGVDEMDIVKTDGNSLFVAREESVAILESWPPTETRLVAELPIVGSRQGIFLNGDRLAVLSSFWATPDQTDVPWGGTRLELVNVHDRGNPQRVRTIELQGHLQGARMIDGHLFLVLGTWIPMPEGVWDLVWRDDLGLPPRDPNLSGEELEAVLELARAILTPLVADIVAGMDIEQLLPQMTDSAMGFPGATLLLECDQVFGPSVRDKYSVLTVAHLDLGAADLEQTPISATGVLTSGRTVYASRRNLYVAQGPSWWWWIPFLDAFGESNTVIHSFALAPDDEDPVRYTASGKVPGQLVNQFSMGEYDGYLRAGSSEGFWGWWGESESPGTVVSVLQDDGDGRLAQIGQVRGISPNEQLYATRFLGDRGYLITFERIDPLFTLDLSDPADPRVVGELEIPGYSAYLHPMDENHLLGVGMHGTEGGQLTGLAVKIFDVSSLESPNLVDDLVIENPEGGWSWSEALYDHHAFTFHGGVLAFPSAQSSWGEGLKAGLTVLQADAGEGLTYLGTVDHSDMPPLTPGEQPWSALVRRSVYIEGALFSISSRGVKVNSLSHPEIELAEVPFADPNQPHLEAGKQPF